MRDFFLIQSSKRGCLQCELQSAGPHPLRLHHRSMGCTSGHGRGCQCSDRSHPTLTRTSQNSMTILSWRRKDTIGVFTDFHIFFWFGQHSGLVGFGFDRFSP